MKRRHNAMQASILSLLVATGCAQRLGMEMPRRVPMVEKAPAELSAAAAPFRHAAALLRQSVLISYQGHPLLLNGLLVLDPEAGTARLLASQEIGPPVLALSVSATGYTCLRPSSPPYDHPRLQEGVAASVRRMFLTPHCPPGTRFTRASHAYRGQFGDGPGAQRSRFGGEPLVLLQASGHSEGGSWRVTYGNYRESPCGYLPMALVYEEPENRLRVTVWNESVEP